jgi:hypothetical protein
MGFIIDDSIYISFSGSHLTHFQSFLFILFHDIYIKFYFLSLFFFTVFHLLCVLSNKNLCFFFFFKKSKKKKRGAYATL